MKKIVGIPLWEYAAKGALVGVLLAIALAPASALVAVVIYGATSAGVALALVLVGWRTVRRGDLQVRGRFAPFVFYLVLECPLAVYSGVLLGLTVGITACLGFGWLSNWREIAVGATLGLLVGSTFPLFQSLPGRWLQSSTILIFISALVAGFVMVLTWYPEWLPIAAPGWFALHLLLAALLVHILTIVGPAEETELECGLATVLIAASLWVLLPERWRLVGLLVPAAWYVLYTGRILPHVQVLKYVLRGWNYAQLRRYRDALLAFQRALRIVPKSSLAREGLWRVHRELSADLLSQQPELRGLVNIDLCVQRAAELLLHGSPSREALNESHKLLQLVLEQEPNRRPEVLYWRAVLYTHAREYDRAAEDLEELLNEDQGGPTSVSRASIIARAWHLALLGHPELRRRVGDVCLQAPGRRIQAIGQIELALQRMPDDPIAREVKQHLYGGLTVTEFEEARQHHPEAVSNLDFGYIYDLGQQLFQTPDCWQRSMEFLHMAAYGMPDRAPGIYYRLGQTYQQHGDESLACYYYEQAKLAARDFGIEKLPADEKHAYFQAVQRLGQIAYRKQDLDRAIENLSLYVESSEAGTDTLRIITELYERKGDAVSALIWNEKALSLDAGNENLLERKHRYYYSVMPEELSAQRERVEKYFDVEYCLQQAKSLVELRNAGEPQLEWALHLLRLVLVLQATNIRALVLCGRIYQRIGNDEEAAKYFQQARAAKPESFASREEEEAWYYATVRLGDYYLYSAHRPDLALACYSDYRRSPKSGADTLFKMGQCYEQLGDVLRAAKCYQVVTVYEHPLANEAYAALARLESSRPDSA